MLWPAPNNLVEYPMNSCYSVLPSQTPSGSFESLQSILFHATMDVLPAQASSVPSERIVFHPAKVHVLQA